jgi:hypothetical protein
VNRGVVLAVGDVAIEEGLGGAFIHKLRDTMMMPSRSAIVTVPV